VPNAVWLSRFGLLHFSGEIAVGLAAVIWEVALLFQSLLRGLAVEMTVAVATLDSQASSLVPRMPFAAFDSRLPI
jgi:hypothetical protein